MINVKRGFTLTEVLIVVIIIGVLSALTIPRYFGQNERGYVAEAVAMLSAIRQAEVAYYLEQSTPAYTATLASLDLDITATKFSYVVSAGTGTATATRTGGVAAFNGKTIILSIAGAWSGTHPYRPT